MNLQALATSLYQWFISKGYQAQYYGFGNYYIVQARKTGFLRHIFAADRAFTVKLFGGQGYLEVNIGIADWVKAEDVTEDAIAGLALGPIGLAVEGIESIWNVEIEREVMNEIERLINSGAVSMPGPYYPQPGYPQQPYYYPQPGAQYYPQPYYQPGYPQYPQQQGKVCPRCGTPNPPNARFCMSCGYQLP